MTRPVGKCLCLPHSGLSETRGALTNAHPLARCDPVDFEVQKPRPRVELMTRSLWEQLNVSVQQGGATRAQGLCRMGRPCTGETGTELETGIPAAPGQVAGGCLPLWSYIPRNRERTRH